ncbi:MAG: FG-GAP repeat protein [Planctomycetota bacterium]
MPHAAKLHAVTASIALTTAGTAARAQPLFEITAYWPDLLTNQAGFDADIDGGILVVGAPFDADLGPAAGAAFLIDTTTGQTIKLLPPGVDAGDQFGSAVAIDGGRAIVGARYDDDLGVNTGAAYVFDAATGVLLRTLQPNQPNTEFGDAVDVDGDFAVIGARVINAGGSAFVYNLNTGDLIHSFPKRGLFGFDEMGDAVAIDSDAGLVAVGAPGEYVSGLEARIGAVHLFDLTTGAFIRSFLAGDPEAFADFGASVAIRGDRLLVGAPLDDNPNVDAGAAYLFDLTTGNQITKLTVETTPNPNQFAQLGCDVELTDTLAIVGNRAYYRDFFSGAGAAFVYDATDGALVARLLPEVPGFGDAFGAGVGIDGSTAVVGSPGDAPPAGLGGTGAVYLYQLPCPPDLAAPAGVLDIFDLLEYLALFSASDPKADIAPPAGTFDFFDVLEYLARFSAGC